MILINIYQKICLKLIVELNIKKTNTDNFIKQIKKINDYNFLFFITYNQCAITCFSIKIVYKSIRTIFNLFSTNAEFSVRKVVIFSPRLSGESLSNPRMYGLNSYFLDPFIILIELIDL